MQYQTVAKAKPPKETPGNAGRTPPDMDGSMRPLWPSVRGSKDILSTKLRPLHVSSESSVFNVRAAIDQPLGVRGEVK